MANKTLNTRIQLKRDSLTNWNESSLVLKPGELAVAYVDVKTTDAHGNIQHVPTALLKAGENVINSSKTFKDLPFVSAIAADVYAWAKKTGIEIVDEGEGEVISDITWENDKLVFSRIDVITPAELAEALANYYTKAEIDKLFENYYTKTEVDNLFTAEVARANKYTDDAIQEIVTGSGYATTKYVDDAVAEHVEDVNTALNNYVLKVDQAAVDNAQNERLTAVEAVADAAQTAEEVTAAINAKVAELDLGNTYEAKGEAAKVSGALEAYKTSNDAAVALKANAADVYTKTEADTAFMTQDEVDARVNKVITDAVEGDALTSLTELVQYINTHGGEAANMAVAIENIEKQLDGIDAGTGTVKKYIDDAITALKIGDYAKASDLADLAARVKAIEDAPYATTGNVATAKQEAIDAAAGDATTKANQALADAKADAEAKYEEIGVAQGLVEGLGIADYLKKADAETTYEKIGVAQTAIDNINYDSDDDADTGDEGVTKLVYKVTQEKGKVAAHKVSIADVKTALNLAAIATSGNVNDLVQTSGDVLIFDCGTSTLVI